MKRRVSDGSGFQVLVYPQAFQAQPPSRLTYSRDECRVEGDEGGGATITSQSKTLVPHGSQAQELTEKLWWTLLSAFMATPINPGFVL